MSFVSWVKNHWKKAVLGACGVVGAVATVVPAVVPAAAVCALVTPVILAGGSAMDVLKTVAGKNTKTAAIAEAVSPVLDVLHGEDPKEK